MARNKSKSLPKFETQNEIVEFFDTHDMGEYRDEMPEADFEIKIKTRKHLIALDEKIAAQLDKVAKSKKVTSESLINTWLREKLETSKRV